MITGIDSSAFRPTAASVADARAAGVRMWSGYIATRSGVKLYSPWSQGDFEVAKQCGAIPLAFASGYDDPVACKRLAAAWGVRLCLDVEDGIRGNGPWVQPWLDASGAGLYANYWVFPGRSAPFYVLTAYPGGGDPAATWNARLVPKPAGPTGWQWVGTHPAFGGSVDSGDYDDWFTTGALEEDEVTPEQLDALLRNSQVFKDVLAAQFRLYTELLYRKAPGPAPEPFNWNNYFQAAHMLDPNIAPDLAMMEFINEAQTEFASHADPVHADEMVAAIQVASDALRVDVTDKSVAAAVAAAVEAVKSVVADPDHSHVIGQTTSGPAVPAPKPPA